MLIGYARVSTNEQDNAAQVAALKAAECERTYREKASGGRWDRPELHRLLLNTKGRCSRSAPKLV
jgi:DNA invertase Pin-like site-specific DNA recombinase